MNKSFKVNLNKTDISDYYLFSNILSKYGIENKIIEKDQEGNELGFDFSELIVLLPVLLPFLEQLRKAVEAYFDYKKGMVAKVEVTLKNGNKELHISSENSEIPDIETLEKFFN